MYVEIVIVVVLVILIAIIRKKPTLPPEHHAKAIACVDDYFRNVLGKKKDSIKLEVVGEDEECCIVRLSYSIGKAHLSMFFRVTQDGDNVTEIGKSELAKMGIQVPSMRHSFFTERDVG